MVFNSEQQEELIRLKGAGFTGVLGHIGCSFGLFQVGLWRLPRSGGPLSQQRKHVGILALAISLLIFALIVEHVLLAGPH
jgi:hypothetical protein